jgi:uncharacterized protein YecE (DUF72 family)
LVEIVRKYDVALVCAVEWPRMMDLTSDFLYCRLHGSEELYASGYTPSSLNQWAARIKAWARGTESRDAVRAIDAPGPKLPARDVFVHFDNDIKVRAPFDAQSLMKRITR